ncbi:sucrose-6-phosphate hydrolase [Vibrio sp. 10N.286.49.B3]|uniref:glycoside hydrolase family 32 protein n=1 Tax=Vibrio sp. 10N.286.49.B3 TaxID=1880855 RepID=UPI000C8469C9|nr:glycoside hydrolase family 32 protein [Vibrio sp. 10N.286.49.B3]PMH43294.1 sucrose-6-phosphate hydrolase [Vibrio sp. 10N.286.49.B3]
MLNSIVKCCGGLKNLTRVLIADAKLIFEIHDDRLLQLDGSEVSFGDVLGKVQVIYPLPEKLSPRTLLAIGNEIKNNQHTLLTAVQDPITCVHRPNWHVSPPQGLLNDPNGFIFHNGQYHLFYQWSPFTCTHKDKYWAHLTSTNLIDWHWQPVALTPSDWFDSHGVFSGHALTVGDELWLYYTGNSRIGSERVRQTTQCLAISKDGINFEKQGPVINSPAPMVTEHMRDPKIIREKDQWLMLLGAQREDMQGRLAAYTSKDLRTWQFDKLYGDELGDFGYMWECPDIFDLGGQTWVVIGPQGIESKSLHSTVPHHNRIAKATRKGIEELELDELQPLDYGFDFYAPQTLLTPDGRRIMSAWMGLPDEIDHPSKGWVHQLTALRELTYVDGQLLQWPIADIAGLYVSEQEIELDANRVDIETKSFDLSLTMEWGQTLHLFENQHQHCKIELDKETQTLFLDRTQTLVNDGDLIRELPLSSPVVSLRILADTSSLEIFVNGGEQVLSARIFTNEDATCLSLDGGCVAAKINKIHCAVNPFA